jgi:hypothetical protein
MVHCYSNYTLRWVVHLFAGATAYPYIRDVMVLQSCISLSSPHGELFKGGRTPLNLAAWEAALRRHPDKDFATYLCSGLRVGLKSATTNLFSSFEYPDIVQWYISSWAGCWDHWTSYVTPLSTLTGSALFPRATPPGNGI